MFTKIRRKWLQSPIAVALVTLVSGRALGQALGIFTTPIVSRLYDAVAFGQFAIITSTTTIICTISQAGMASAIMIPEQDGEAQRVFSTVFGLQLAIITLFTAVAIPFLPFYRSLYEGIPSTAGLALLYLYMLLSNLTNLLTIYMNRKGLYRALFWNSLIGALATLCVTIPLGIIGVGFIGLIVASLISMVICTTQMLYKANPFTKINFRLAVENVKKYRDFVLYQFPANLVGTFSLQLPNQILIRGFGSAALGSYSMSNKILNIPLSFLAQPISTVYFKTVVEYYQADKDIAGFTFKLVSILMLLALIPLFLMIAFGESLFAFILGEGWREAGKLAAILSYQYVLVFCNACTSYCRVAIGRQRINLTMSIVQLMVIVTSLFVGLYISKNLIIVITCFAIGNSLFQVSDMTVNFFCMKKYVVKYLIFILIYSLILGMIGLTVRI